VKRQLKGLKRRDVQLDLNLYRVDVPFKSISDMNLSVVDLHPEGIDNALVFVHGYAGCAETWEYQINYFSKTHRVVAPDLRGHGQSDAPFTRYTMDELDEDLLTLRELLNLPEKIILAGHSFGGAICIEFATRHPEMLNQLILISTAGEYPLPRLTSLASRIPTAVFRPWWRFRPRWNADPHVLKRMMLNNMRNWRGWDLIEEIRTPTLIITGERDRYFPRWVFSQVAEKISDAEVVDIGASKHKVQLERHQAVNRAIDRFVGKPEMGKGGSWRGGRVIHDLPEKLWHRSYARYTPHSIPIPRQPLHKFLEASSSWVPKRTATLFYGSSLTYQQLNQKVNQLAHSLHGLGLRRGDRVMLILPNMPQMLIAYYAVLKMGGVVVLPNPDADAEQILFQIKQTEAKILVTIMEFVGLAEVLKRQVPIEIIFTEIRKAVSSRVYRNLMERWKSAGVSEHVAEEPPNLGYRMSKLMMDASVEEPEVEISPQDLAAILYTSGTTDEPKGVCLTHHNLVANALQTRHWIPNIDFGKETFLSVLPLTHSYGMTTAMNIPIALGATIVLLPVFELDQVLEHIQQYKPSIFPGVPSIYMAINGAPKVRSYGLSSIKACVSGAAPLPIEVQETFEKLTRGRLVEGYGLTEASPVTHVNPFQPTEKVGSIGIPIPNTDAKIVDLVTGDDLPPGQIGELAVRGPQVMSGYWGETGMEDGESSLQDGWLLTGDVAVMDQDGFFQIISRKRDTIMAGDYSIYPRDVEEVLYENSKVMEAAVVGVASSEGTQKVKAFIVPRPGTQLSKEELLDLCRKRLDEYAIPWDIEFREELPKSFVGKVLRRMLVEEVE
jgi:long-chain acyl-CoA synthetase